MFLRPLYQQVYRVRQNREDTFQALFDCFGAAGEVNNQGAPTRSCHASREHAEGSMLNTDGTHGFGDTRSFAVNNRSGRLRRDIAGSKACPTGSEDEVEVFLIAPFAQGCLDLVALV